MGYAEGDGLVLVGGVGDIRQPVNDIEVAKENKMES